MITIVDVASYAGVSTATVSRVLNSPDAVKAETREKVLKAIEATGYTPSKAARALKTDKTCIIGALLPDFSDRYYLSLIGKTEKILLERGYSVLLSGSFSEPSVQVLKSGTLLQLGADALIAVPVKGTSQFFSSLVEKGKPVILLDSDIPEFATDVVFTGKNSALVKETASLLSDLLIRRLEGDYSDFPVCFTGE